MWGYNAYPGRCPGLCDCWAFSPFITTLLVLPDSNNSAYNVSVTRMQTDMRDISVRLGAAEAGDLRYG